MIQLWLFLFKNMLAALIDVIDEGPILITCLGRQRAQIGMLQHLEARRPYLIYLSPIVLDKLRRSSQGS